jgi:ubiquinone/menaquinone biosynthesis C-methylase UbiE
MDEPYPSKLQVWSGPAALAGDPSLPPGGRSLAAPPAPADLADRLYQDETMAPTRRPAEGAEPYSLQWFLDVEAHRYGRHGRWFPRLLEFAKHAGETLLGVGGGLGTDWLQYARHGASVVACSPSAEQLALVRRNFELRGLSGRFLHATPRALPLESASIDVVCLGSFLHDLAEPRALVDEVYRVLKPGGKVLAVAPAKHDVDFWFACCFPWQRWLLRGTPAAPGGTRYSARGLRKLFGQFVEHRVHKRQLRRAEVPHVWRWLPPAVLERLMGRVLVVKAFKPLSAAMSVHAAA